MIFRCILGFSSYTVRNELFLFKAADYFKITSHYKVTKIAQIQMNYISGYYEN